MQWISSKLKCLYLKGECLGINWYAHFIGHALTRWYKKVGFVTLRSFAFSIASFKPSLRNISDTFDCIRFVKSMKYPCWRYFKNLYTFLRNQNKMLLYDGTRVPFSSFKKLRQFSMSDVWELTTIKWKKQEDIL